MNILIIFCLWFFLIVRIVGFVVSLDFYYEKRDLKSVIFMLSWIFLIIGNVFAILLNIEFQFFIFIPLLVLNTIFISFGTIFYAWGIRKYLDNILDKFIIFLIFFSFTLIVLGHIYDEIYPGSGSDLFYAIIYVIVVSVIFYIYIIPLTSKEFKNKMGTSLRWYHLMVICLFSFFALYIITSMQYGYGAYDADDPIIIMINYIPIIIATLLMILLLIHLEYNISNKKKFELKDKYSHNLGNIMQAISTANEIINKKEVSKAESTELGELIETKIKEASELIKEIREL